MYLKSKKREECCGCSACEQICKKQAILMQYDEEGFRYPVINSFTCVGCGMCEQVCPVHFTKKQIQNENPKVFASYLSDKAERTRSSSGGLFYAFAHWIIKNGGVVFGAAFDDSFKLHHKWVDNLNDLEQLRGSKYLQSDLRNVYSEVKNFLQNERWVYFVGTPCQVAGLKTFLRKDYSTLLTSDLVCHGTPSQLLFDQHLSYLEEKEEKKIVGYRFRDDRSWNVCETAIFLKNNGKVKKRILPTYELSPYLFSFMHAYTYRLSCYVCQFAKIPRQGDISLADFWGANTFFKNMDTSKGVSLVLINSQKGEVIWNEVKPKCAYFESNIHNASKYNHNLIAETKKPIIRDFIYEKIRIEGYRAVAETDFRIQHWRIKYLFRILIEYQPLKKIVCIYRKMRRR